MVVVIANNIPPAVRGRMKLWFIEPKPNVFVSGISDHVADGVIEYLIQHCPSTAGLIIFQKITVAPWYKIYGMGEPSYEFTEISGLQLIINKNEGE